MKRTKHQTPEYRQRMRHIAYFVQQRNEPYSGTRRGLGTGAGRTKGIPNKYNSKVRQAIAIAKSVLEAGIPLNDVVCRLLRIAIDDPETFQGVLEAVPPRGPGMNNPVRYRFDLFGDIKEPTDKEIADTLGLPEETVTRIRLSGSDTYDLWREKTIRARMSPAQRDLLETIEHQAVLSSYFEAKREQQQAKLKRKRNVARRR